MKEAVLVICAALIGLILTAGYSLYLDEKHKEACLDPQEDAILCHLDNSREVLP